MRPSTRIAPTLVFSGLALDADLAWSRSRSRSWSAPSHDGGALAVAAACPGDNGQMTWLTRTYFTSYAAGQVLPTAIGGDAWRIVETPRRHPGRRGDITAIVLERGLGGAATLALGAIGFSSPSAATTSAPTSGSKGPSSSPPS